MTAGKTAAIGVLVWTLVLTMGVMLPAQAMALGERDLSYGMTGTDVAELQQQLQARGYYIDYAVDGIFGPGTQAAVKMFQQRQELPVDGIVGSLTLQRIVPQQSLDRQLVRATYLVRSGDTLWLLAQQYGTTVIALKEVNKLTGSIIYVGQTLAIPAVNEIELPQPSRGGKRYGELIHWDQAKNVFGMYEYALVTDVATGISFKVQRRGGYLHADVQPVTAADTAMMKQVYGQWSWARRAILVTVDGRTLAASMNGMPHGDGAITDNNFPGQFCIHFLGSQTHGSKRVDPAHQQAVKVAAGLD